MLSEDRIMRVNTYSPEDKLGTTEVMNDLANFLLEHKFIECDPNCGVQEASTALCEFEVHVIRKRKK